MEHISALVILHADFGSICGPSAGSIVVKVLCVGHMKCTGYPRPKATQFFDGQLGLVDLQTVINVGAFVFVDPSFEESYKAKKQGCQPLAAEFQKVTTKYMEYH